MAKGKKPHLLHLTYTEKKPLPPVSPSPYMERGNNPCTPKGVKSLSMRERD
jgi:hypothetical protein